MTATLVTGAAGFIGLNLVEVLLSEGNDVVAFDTRALPARAMNAFSALPGHLVTVEGDVTDAASLVRAFAHPVGRILHAAAITSGPEREMAMPGRIVAVNVIGTVNVAKAAEHHRVRRLLLVSSAAVYGPLPESETEWGEDSPLAPGSLYGVTKLTAELTAQRLAALYGLDLTIGRLGWIFGPWEHRSGARDTMSPVYQLTTAALAGKSTSLPRRDRRMWTYSRDAARGAGPAAHKRHTPAGLQCRVGSADRPHGLGYPARGESAGVPVRNWQSLCGCHGGPVLGHGPAGAVHCTARWRTENRVARRECRVRRLLPLAHRRSVAPPGRTGRRTAMMFEHQIIILGSRHYRVDTPWGLLPRGMEARADQPAHGRQCGQCLPLKRLIPRSSSSARTAR